MVSTLGVYSTLLTEKFNEDQVFNEMFLELAGSRGKLTFGDYIYAGSVPVPKLSSLIEKWILFLFNKTEKATSTILREAAVMSGKNEISVMEEYIRSAGGSAPIAYINLCELYLEQGDIGAKKALSIAEEGLKKTSAEAFDRDDLARLMSRVAKERNNDNAYKYAISECFFSTAQLEDFLPIMDLHDADLKNAAVAYLDKLYESKKNRYYSHGSIDYHEIHFLNQDYDLAFSFIESDDKALGWTGSIKGVMIPLFIGLLAGFNEQAVTIGQNIGAVLGIKDLEALLRCLRENVGEYSTTQEHIWYDRCVSEVEKRTDAIVSGGFRNSYYKAARLLVAIAEMREYRNEMDSIGIIRTYIAKYPRHTAFRGELRTLLNGSMLPKIKV